MIPLAEEEHVREGLRDPLKSFLLLSYFVRESSGKYPLNLVCEGGIQI